MKALIGSWDHRPYKLLAELTALRTRVAELQQELAEERATNAALRQALSESIDNEVAVVDSANDLDVTVGAG